MKLNLNINSLLKKTKNVLTSRSPELLVGTGSPEVFIQIFRSTCQVSGQVRPDHSNQVSGQFRSGQN